MKKNYQVNPFPIFITRRGVFMNLIAISMFMFFSMQAAEAQRAWGYVCGAIQTPDSPLEGGNFYDFNLADGTATLLGAPSCGGASPDLFAGEFVGGVFYALNNSDLSLITLDEDGTCTYVGPLTGVTAGHTVSGLSHNPASGTTYVLSTNVSVTHLYTIDLLSGTLTFVGPVTGVGGGISLMINDLGEAYVLDIVFDAIYPVNLATAVIGPGVPITFLGAPVDLNFAQDADFDCGEGALVQGVLYTGGGNGRLGTLDPSTGVFVQTAFLGAEVCAFSIDCSGPPPVIPLSNWSIYLFAFLILTFVVVRYLKLS